MFSIQTFRYAVHVVQSIVSTFEWSKGYGLHQWVELSKVENTLFHTGSQQGHLIKFLDLEKAIAHCMFKQCKQVLCL